MYNAEVYVFDRIMENSAVLAYSSLRLAKNSLILCLVVTHHYVRRCQSGLEHPTDYSIILFYYDGELCIITRFDLEHKINYVNIHPMACLNSDFTDVGFSPRSMKLKYEWFMKKRKFWHGLSVKFNKESWSKELLFTKTF